MGLRSHVGRWDQRPMDGRTGRPVSSAPEVLMRRLALLLVLPTALVRAQAAAPATVEETASPELVGQLVKEVGVTPAQAQSGAGALFGVAKTKLPAADFAKVAGAVPNMDGLLKAAPGGEAKS